MADWLEPTEEVVQEWEDWLKGRPQVIQDLAARFKPWKLYRHAVTGHRMRVVSFNEDGTVHAWLNGEFNMVAMERGVTGIQPDSLTECDLPEDGERVGCANLTPEEMQLAMRMQRRSLDQLFAEKNVTLRRFKRSDYPIKRRRLKVWSMRHPEPILAPFPMNLEVGLAAEEMAVRFGYGTAEQCKGFTFCEAKTDKYEGGLVFHPDKLVKDLPDEVELCAPPGGSV